MTKEDRAKNAVNDECVFTGDQIASLHDMIDELGRKYSGIQLVSDADVCAPLTMWTNGLGEETWSFDAFGCKNLFDNKSRALKAYEDYLVKRHAPERCDG